MEVADLLRSTRPGWLDGCDDEALVAEVVRLQRHRSRVEAAIAGVRAEMRSRRRPGTGRDRAEDDDVSSSSGTSSKQSRLDRQRGELTDQLPLLAAAWTAGRISGEHVDAVARIPDRHRDRRDADETAIVEAACAMPVDEFVAWITNWTRRHDRATRTPARDVARNERCLRKDQVPDLDGLTTLFARLDPDSDRVVSRALSIARRRNRLDGDDRSLVQQRLDALVAICQHYLTGDAAAPAAPVVYWVGTDQTLDLPGLDHLTDRELEALLATADQRTLLTNGAGAPLYLGRTVRNATQHQRDALRAAHPTCVGLRCPTPIEDCVIHHVTHWRHGGQTDPDNLIPLCDAHHHQLHDTPWTLTLDRRTRLVTWHPPPDTTGWDERVPEPAPAAQQRRANARDHVAGRHPGTNRSMSAERQLPL